MRSYTLLWVIDAARLLGDEERADALERRLFDEGRLNVYRVPEVLERSRTKEGAAAALEAGEKIAAYQLHEKVLEALVAAANAAGRPDRDAHWMKIAAQADAARATLKTMDEER